MTTWTILFYEWRNSLRQRFSILTYNTATCCVQSYAFSLLKYSFAAILLQMNAYTRVPQWYSCRPCHSTLLAASTHHVLLRTTHAAILNHNKGHTHAYLCTFTSPHELENSQAKASLYGLGWQIETQRDYEGRQERRRRFGCGWFLRQIQGDFLLSV